MNPDEIRAEWDSIRDVLVERWTALKDPQQVTVQLSRAYARSDAEQQRVIHDVLRKWLLSDDEARRFDALTIVEEHKVRSAMPALRGLQDRLEREQASPGAPYEWAWVNRVIGTLASSE